MKYTLLFATVFLFYTSANAQTVNAGKGKISGKVTDADNKAPVEYATIAIYKQGNKSPVNGSTSDTKGNFVVTNLAYGEYQVSVDFIGYKRYVIDHVIISAAKATMALGNIAILQSQRELKSINITGQASTVENKIDKLVFNVGNDLTSQGGVATDILKKVPMVTVDIDGNVELLGNPSVKFLINGKPSSIFGASLADALQSIPSSEIKSIEVITSPGAKYDASGTGGIINIILKDNKVLGYNGSVNLSAGTRLENGSLNLNARQKNFGVNLFFSGNETLRSNALASKNRLDTTTTNFLHQTQNSIGNFERNGYQTGIGFDWNITKNDNITAGARFHHSANHIDGVTYQDDAALYLNNTFASDTLSTRNSNTQSDEDALDLNLEYKKTFKKDGQELDIQYNSSFNNSNGNFYQKTDYNLKPSAGSTGNNPGKDKETEISIDYAHPVTDDFTLETGAKLYLESVNSTSDITSYDPTKDIFISSPLQSTSFNYGRNVYSYYLSASFPLFNFFDIKAGLRDEYTTTNVDAQSTGIPDYNFLSPSFVVQHKLSKTKSLKLAYSKRIERPDFGDLNPFLNASDPSNPSIGNPNLHPEIGNNFEFGYNSSYSKGGNINITAFYRHNGFDVKSYSIPYTTYVEYGKSYNNVNLTVRDNVGAEVTTGVNMSLSIPFTDDFTIRPNMLVSQRRIMDNIPNASSFVMGYEYRLNMNATYNFKHDMAGEAFINYNSPRVGLQGKNSSFIAYSFAFRKQFWDKKASLGLTTTVPFNEYVNQTSTIIQPGHYQYSLRQVPFRSFGITLSYKFGKLEFKKDQEKDNNSGLPQPDQQ